MTESKWGELIDRLDKALFTKQQFIEPEEGSEIMANGRQDEDRWKLDKR